MRRSRSSCPERHTSEGPYGGQHHGGHHGEHHGERAGLGGGPDRRSAPPGRGDGWKRVPPRRALLRALSLTLAATLLWGIVHIRAGRRTAGVAFLTLFVGIFGTIGAGTAMCLASPRLRDGLLQYAVHPTALAAAGTGLLALALVWSSVIVLSYRQARPAGLPRRMDAIGGLMVVALCLSVAAPLVHGARTAYAQRELVNSVFAAAGSGGDKVDQADPWKDRPRVNILLIGGDSGPDRMGVRTDSMTIASVDTRTGDTVMFSLPRNLEDAPMPGPRRGQFPRGYQGRGPGDPGLLNEVWQYAEEHPALLPGVPKGKRGPRMLKASIGEILGLHVDNYVLVNMAGFAAIVDAIGGVRMKVERPIPYGPGNVVKPGERRLRGIEAVWYGRYRSDGSDYTRMRRQKCLLAQLATQADPTTVLTKFNRLARAMKKAIATDIPKDLLPALVALSAKVKQGARIRTVQFVPPMILPGRPDFGLIRRHVDAAIASGHADRGAAARGAGLTATFGAACASTASQRPATRR
jgi:anionic cell wall polymer biosynthesis LytR-Cps2A-Psr (LCP) family protein